MAACPYGARYFNWKESNPPPSKQAIADYTPEFANVHLKGTVEKCDFCVHLARQGTLPPCVQACPTKAIYYGDLNEDAVSNTEETIPLFETLERAFGYRFKEELGTEPQVYYLPPRRY
jgi:molybdopterin-containing oxidoreductase family iron-sulfur binding subunit